MRDIVRRYQECHIISDEELNQLIRYSQELVEAAREQDRLGLPINNNCILAQELSSCCKCDKVPLFSKYQFIPAYFVAELIYLKKYNDGVGVDTTAEAMKQLSKDIAHNKMLEIALRGKSRVSQYERGKTYYFNKFQLYMLQIFKEGLNVNEVYALWRRMVQGNGKEQVLLSEYDEAISLLPF